MPLSSSSESIRAHCRSRNSRCFKRCVKDVSNTVFKNDSSTSVEVPFGAFVRPTSRRQVRRIKDYIKMKIRQSPECHDDCHCPAADDDLASNVDSDKHLVVASGSVSQPLRASAVSHNS